jgi:hypothetical protein
MVGCLQILFHVVLTQSLITYFEDFYEKEVSPFSHSLGMVPGGRRTSLHIGACMKRLVLAVGIQHFIG